MLLAQVVNFTILALVLGKFLYKPILKMLDERRKKIEEGLKLTEKMKIKEAELDSEREKVLDKAKAEGVKIIEEHRDKAKKVEADIIIKAGEEAKVIKEKAKAELEEEKKIMRSDLNSQVLSIATAMAKTVVLDLLDQKAQTTVIEKKLQLLEKERVHG